ncbi:MAG: molybdopterin-dependent oxidoreductase [bacterium]|nr:molybdopterin-dependent oxidoreductase [bacterium]
MASGPSDDHETAAGRSRRFRLKPQPGSTVPWAALAGLLSAGAAISVGELISGISDRGQSLILGVSDAIVDSRFVPGAVIRWSIDTFGSAQKPLLFYGVLAATLVLGALTGIVARRHRWVIAVVFVAFGTLGGLAVNISPTAATSMAVLTAALAVVVGGGTLWGMLRLISPIQPASATGIKPRQPHPYLNETGRRWFLTAAGATAVGALAASGVGRFLGGRRGDVAAGRASVADLLSSAEVRTDAGGAGTETPATTVGGGTTPTTVGGGSAPAPVDSGTTKPTSGPGGETLDTGVDEASTVDTAAPSPTTTAPGETTPTTVAADGDQVAAPAPAPGPAPVESGDTAVPTTQAPAAPAEQAASGTTQPSAGGNAPPVGDPGERTTTTTTQAPPPTTQAPPPPPPPPPQRNRAGYYDNTVNGISPIVTPNSDFYRIDTAIVVPSVDVNSWELSISGMVDRPYTLSFAELIDMGLVETPVTLSCVSNQVGGNLVDNAVWRGVPLSDVLNRAGVQRGATQIVGRSVDNWNSGFPTEYAFDGRVALVAVAMNGEPLPREHGFPVRLVIAGLYGYVSATKWLEEIRLTTWEGFDSYWVPRGWAKRGPIKTQSRIDVPRRGSRVRAGRVAVAGVAWAPTKSVQGVEVQIGNGPWVAAEVSNNMSVNSWRQWVYAWDARPGSYQIRCRATDGTGYTQTSEVRPPAPDGATGWHTINVTVV